MNNTPRRRGDSPRSEPDNPEASWFLVPHSRPASADTERTAALRATYTGLEVKRFGIIRLHNACGASPEDKQRPRGRRRQTEGGSRRLLCKEETSLSAERKKKKKRQNSKIRCQQTGRETCSLDFTCWWLLKVPPPPPVRCCETKLVETPNLQCDSVKADTNQSTE